MIILLTLPKHMRQLFFALALIIMLSTKGFSQWTNGQAASVVLGQADMVSGSWNTTSSTFTDCSNIAIDKTNNKLYVADKGNHRVLRFSLPIAGNQPVAECVFGQANFTSATSGTTSTTFNNPAAIAVDASARLWVLDCGNNRVLWFNNANSASNGATANGVLGQADFTSSSSGTTDSRFTLNTGGFEITGITVSSAGGLYVSDHFNHRVLRFDNASSKSNGAAADGVLGQANFTSGSANRGGSVASNTLNFPMGIAITGTTMYVADQSNNRVLRFDNPAAASNGAAADGVLGQSLFTTSSAATTQSTMNGPAGVTIDGTGRLYVLDRDNFRVITYNTAASKSNGANADNVLGQANFTTAAGSTSSTTLEYPYGLAVDATNARLYIADFGANRVLRYNASTALPVEMSSFKVEYHDHTNEIRWTTLTEENTSLFCVEKSIDGVQWSKLGEVKAAGHSNTPKAYFLKDYNVGSELTFYRLKQTDEDGKFSYSNVLEINHSDEEIALKIYPNPNSGRFNIELEGNYNTITSFKVLNILGNEIYSHENFQHEIDLSNQPEGTYFVQITLNNEVLTRKITLTNKE